MINDVNSHLAKLVDLYGEYLESPESVSHQMINQVASAKGQQGKACFPTSPSQALTHARSLYPGTRVFEVTSNVGLMIELRMSVV